MLSFIAVILGVIFAPIKDAIFSGIVTGVVLWK